MHILLTIAQIDTSTFPKATAGQGTLQAILKIVFSITGSIALLMIVIGGFRYIVAKGEPGDIAQAKNTILYAIIGLVVSLTAFSIVTFVIKGVS